MYQYVWNKFLPVVALKIKTALKKGELQLVEFDRLDFEKVSIKKSGKHQFRLEMRQGRALRSKDNSPVSLDFARALNEYETTRELIKSGGFIFNLNSKFVLSIEATPAPQPSLV